MEEDEFKKSITADKALVSTLEELNNDITASEVRINKIKLSYTDMSTDDGSNYIQPVFNISGTLIADNNISYKFKAILPALNSSYYS